MYNVKGDFVWPQFENKEEDGKTFLTWAKWQDLDKGNLQKVADEMSELHTDDTFMYENCLVGDAGIDEDPLVNRITHQRGPKAPSTESQQQALDDLVRDAEDLGLYDDTSANESEDPMHRQVSGSHYNKYPIQPAEYCYKNGLNNLQSEAISYITRYGDKGGKTDLEKAIHTLDMLIHMEYGE